MRFIKKYFGMILLMCLAISALLIVPAAAQRPVVQAVLYWENGCPACETVLNDFLPDLQNKYGDHLELEQIEVVSVEDINLLYQIGNVYGLVKEEIGVPLLIIGDTVLVGSEAISAQLPNLIDQYLAEGGVNTQVREVLQESELNAGLSQDQTILEEPIRSGMTLAWIMMSFMLIVLVFTLIVVYRAFQGKPLSGWPNWVEISIPVLAVIGLGIAGYLTYVEATYTPVICGPVGDCNAVQSSSYARIFGVIPVGLFGALGYVGILASWIYARIKQDNLGAYSPIAILGMAGFGTIYSVYLTYLEIFVIHAVCIWCISSAFIITLILLASLPAAANWLAFEEEVES